MSYLFAAKHPPIQGGESSKLYWLTKELSRDEDVTIVTNADEVEDHHRIKHGKGKNQSTIIQTTPTQTVIPETKAYSEKITSNLIEEIQRNDPDSVIGWYLLPYGIATGNAARITGKNYGIQHAGSDMKRHRNHGDLKTLINETINDAEYILSYPSHVDFFKQRDKNVIPHHPVIPDEFRPEGETVELGQYTGKEENLLFLGKTTGRDGLPRVLETFQNIEDRGLVVVGDGKNRKGVEYQYEKENIYFHDFIHPELVPSYMRGADATVIPEYNFGVEAHYSRIPIESTLTGTRPLVSNSIREKYEIGDRFLPLHMEDKEKLYDDLTRSLESDFKAYAEELQKEKPSFSSYVEHLASSLP